MIRIGWWKLPRVTVLVWVFSFRLVHQSAAQRFRCTCPWFGPVWSSRCSDFPGTAGTTESAPSLLFKATLPSSREPSSRQTNCPPFHWAEWLSAPSCSFRWLLRRPSFLAFWPTLPFPRWLFPARVFFFKCRLSSVWLWATLVRSGRWARRIWIRGWLWTWFRAI